MAKAGSERAALLQTRRSAVNTAAPLPIFDEAEARVLGMQIKLHMLVESRVR